MRLQIDLYPETAALFIPCKSVELPIIKLNCKICKISHFNLHSRQLPNELNIQYFVKILAII